MTDKITKDMTLGEIIEKRPNSAEIMGKYGLHCIGCHLAPSETLEEGSKAHGMNDEEIKKMVDEINHSKPEEDDQEETEEETNTEESEEPEEEKKETTKTKETKPKKGFFKKIIDFFKEALEDDDEDTKEE